MGTADVVALRKTVGKTRFDLKNKDIREEFTVQNVNDSVKKRKHDWSHV